MRAVFPLVLLGSGLLALSSALATRAQDAEPAMEDDGARDELAKWLGRLTDDGRAVRLEDVEGMECAECHAAITDEWRHSAHATAWQDEHYQSEVKKIRRKQKCHGCHAPPPMVAVGFPQHPDPREENLHLGIDCVACHMDADGVTVHGPFGLESAAHPTLASEHFTGSSQSAMCVACHATSIGPVIGIAKDFVETEQAELDLSCIGCHMPALRGPIANDPQDTAAVFPVRKRRSHRLMTPRDPAFLASAFALKAETRDGQTVLSIENQTGHRVPGTTRRRLTFVARVIDSHGDVVAEGEHAIDHRSYLPVEETVELALDEVGVQLWVEGRHEAPGIRRHAVFLERTFDL